MKLSYNDRYHIQVALSERIKMLGIMAARHKKDGLDVIADQLTVDLNEAKHARETVRCL